MNKYVLVTAISTHRMRYCIPLDDLQKMNEDMPVDPAWACDSVTMNEVNEFSQDHIGELIVDYNVLTEDEILEQFDKDNNYLITWTKEKKLEHIRNWRFDDK
jgi:hypothetical protein